jgi:hypothetical protein
MKHSKVPVALVAACIAMLTLAAGSAGARADGYTSHRHFHAKRFYSGRIRYYNSQQCPYGDCPCIRRRAIATGSPVWWDRYDACTG